MQLSSEQILPVSQDVAWRALNDTAILKSSIPGCDSITPTAENEFDVEMTAAIGPVKAKFKGKMRLSDVDAPNSYVINFEGQGGAAGHGKGSASVRLEPITPLQTRLVYSATAQVGGKIAQVGSRLVDMAARKMANEFFGAFNARLEELYGAKPDASTKTEPDVAPTQPDDASPESSWGKLVSGARGIFK